MRIHRATGLFYLLKLPFSSKKSKFAWTPDGVRTEKFSRFLEQHGPHLEFDSRSFNYSIAKEGSNGVMCEKNSTQLTDMKYQFKMKIFHGSNM